jgi:hypothetical protein
LFTAQASGQHLYMLAKGGSGLGTQPVLTPAAAKKTGLTSRSTTAERVKALNGLTIASASAPSSWTAQANKAAAAQGAKIKWTYIAETALAAAMKQGNIDDLVAAPPWTTQVLFNKTPDMWLNGPAGSFPGGFVVPSYGDPLVATTKAYTTSDGQFRSVQGSGLRQAGRVPDHEPVRVSAGLGGDAAAAAQPGPDPSVPADHSRARRRHQARRQRAISGQRSQLGRRRMTSSDHGVQRWA